MKAFLSAPARYAPWWGPSNGASMGPVPMRTYCPRERPEVRLDPTRRRARYGVPRSIFRRFAFYHNNAPRPSVAGYRSRWVASPRRAWNTAFGRADGHRNHREGRHAVVWAVP